MDVVGHVEREVVVDDVVGVARVQAAGGKVGARQNTDLKADREKRKTKA